MLSVGVLIDLWWRKESGGQVKCWERLAKSSHVKMFAWFDTVFLRWPTQFNSNDPEYWAKAIATLMNNPSTLSTMRLATYQQSQIDYPTWETVLTKDLLSIWQSTITAQALLRVWASFFVRINLVRSSPLASASRALRVYQYNSWKSPLFLWKIIEQAKRSTKKLRWWAGFISCPVTSVVYIFRFCRGGFYQTICGTTRCLNKPTPVYATDATGHDITRLYNTINTNFLWKCYKSTCSDCRGYFYQSCWEKTNNFSKPAPKCGGFMGKWMFGQAFNFFANSIPLYFQTTLAHQATELNTHQ